MREQDFAAECLLAQRAEIARVAAERLVAAHPELAQRYWPDPAGKWAAHHEGRVLDLAAALSGAGPAQFREQIAWAATAFEAREVPVEDLRHSLGVLGEVVARHLAPEDCRLVAAHLDAGLAALDGAHPAPPTALSVQTRHGRLGAEYLLALLKGDRRAAVDLVLHAAQRGELSVRDAYTEVLQPVQRELGRMWHLNEITVAEEHFATATSELTLSALYGMLPRQSANGLSVVACAVEGNAHVLGIRMVADFLEMAGWRVLFLGGNLPAADVAMCALTFRPELLALSATLAIHLDAVRETIRQVRAAHRLPIIVGGAAFAGSHDLWRAVGADDIADSATEAVERAQRLIDQVRDGSFQPAMG